MKTGLSPLGDEINYFGNIIWINVCCARHGRSRGGRPERPCRSGARQYRIRSDATDFERGSEDLRLHMSDLRSIQRDRSLNSTEVINAMPATDTLQIIAFLITATILEVSGDAVIRIALAYFWRP
jgi:hypothetical protein